jgi:hypothetical protein
MTVWSFLKRLIGPTPIATRDELRQFAESRAAYVVQKSIMEYCQARANMLFTTLLGEKDFQAAYERARWQGYPAALSMVLEMVEGMLRPHVGSCVLELHRALLGIARETFSGFPPPAGEGPEFWRDAEERIDKDLGIAALAPARPVHAIPTARAREIFDVLPVHERVRAHDFEMFGNTLRFHLTEVATEFDERADLTSLSQALIKSPESVSIRCRP